MGRRATYRGPEGPPRGDEPSPTTMSDPIPRSEASLPSGSMHAEADREPKGAPRPRDGPAIAREERGVGSRMVVVLSGSTGVSLLAVARALGRSLDATVLDGDRLPGTDASPTDAGPEDRWLDALDGVLREPGPRPHMVVTHTGLTPRSRRKLRFHRPWLALAMVRDPAAPTPDELEDESVVSIDADGGVEAVAARLYARLVLRLASPDVPAQQEGISLLGSDDVCSGQRD
jgi:hypothetical protein